MKTIGIIGGLGPESTVSYYSYITRKYYETYGDYAYPEIIIYSVSFSEFIDVGYEAAPKVTAVIERLARAGADFVVAACNSIHIVYDEVAKNIPIPWISIMDVTGEKVKEAGISKVGLLGTVFTMTKGFYQKALAGFGIECITPPADAQDEINRIIFDELVIASVRDDSKQFVLGCIEALGQRGAQGVVLACTELPFLIQQDDTALPVFDTTAIHAQKALELAMAGCEPR
jgi:aspartate racemase